VHNAQAIRERVEQNDARKEINAKRDAEAQAEEAVLKAIPSAVVTFRHDPPWSTERITEPGKEGLRRFGIAPPDDVVRCPRCGSEQVLAENLFGPTRCRAIYYCRACRSPFEAFKAI
jgi:ring-1,2-phenylacetyl-CoA epoxidase subunit PaaD